MQRAEIYSGIDLSTQNLQELCAYLNEFALPRAIVDFERHSFVAWNPRFLEQTGFSEDEMKTSKPEELLTIGESWFPLPDETASKTVEYIACAARRPFGGDPLPGYVVRSHSKIGYVMLDVFDSCHPLNSSRVGSQAARKSITESLKSFMKRFLLQSSRLSF